MSAEAAVYARLSGYSGLTDLVGDRIYPMVIPPDKRGDAVTYQLIVATPTHAMGADAAVSRSRIQVSCHGTETSSQSAYAAGKAVRDQVVEALKRFRGTVGGVVVQDIFKLTEIDLYDEDVKKNGVAVDFDVVFEE